MKTRIAFLCLGLSLFAVGTLQGQPLSPILSLTIGSIRTLQSDPELPSFAFSPQLELSVPGFQVNEAGLTIGGGVYAGAWSDGVKTPTRSKDAITYSYRSLIVGARVSVALNHIPAPLSIRGGFSRHIFWATYIDGAGVGGRVDHRRASNALEFGVRLQMPLSRRVGIGGDAQVYLMLPFDENNPRAIRAAYSLVASYVL